ncbi:Toxin RelE2 [Brevundimonas sp. SH203]|uniref:type II toxin-antitoxin system RelE/ParE family toxin n=1 Tax=Brevundimonas sp. SH203 TaxID=345167 RepID=UPI0009C9191C|nr:type II toxin-antitoxin system RelE/ParE family toxin [Brevundimonas sp. SH203]GAW40237.1 Toxin RelE2 [Brevundimonas sp. SH203]
MRAVVWSRRALLELTQAIDYLAGRNLPAAQKIEARIIEATEKLARRPIGRPGKQPDTYEKLVTGAPYLIVYALADTADGGQVQIMRLFHTAQDRD